MIDSKLLEYEKYKLELIKLNLTSEEYENLLKIKAEELGI